MKFTRQFDQMDCGPACIRMVASAYGKEYPLSYLRSIAHLTREGVSVAGIRDALREIGMESAAFEMTTEQLREKCPLPAILHWEQNHFVVLTYVKKSRTGGWKYRVANPAYGQHTFSEEAFAKFWLNGEKGVVIAMEPTEDFHLRKPVKEKHSFIRFGRKYVWPFRRELAQSALGMLAGLMLSLVTPFLTQAMVDDGIGMRNMGLIVNIMLAQIFLFIGSFSMGLVGSWVSLYMSTRISINILTDYLTKLLRLPMTFFDTKSVGDYHQRLGDHGRLQSFVTYGTLQTFFALVSAPFYLAIIGWYSPVILAAYLLFTAAGMAWMAYFFRRRKALDYEQFKLSAENQNKQYELMSGITDIKLNAYEDYKLGEWQALQERQYRMSRRAAAGTGAGHRIHAHRAAAQHLHHLLDCRRGGGRQSYAGHDDEHFGHHRTGERAALAAHGLPPAVSGRENQSGTLRRSAPLPQRGHNGDGHGTRRRSARHRGEPPHLLLHRQHRTAGA